MVERVAWVDASAGASGDLLLGALVDAGVPIGVMAEAIEKVATGARLHEERVHRGGVAATCCRVDVEDMRRAAHLAVPSRCCSPGQGCTRTSARWPTTSSPAWPSRRAAPRVVPAEDVHLHDVGSPQAIAEVVGVCAGVVHLGIRRLVVSPGPVVLEQCTPVGAALLTALADDWGPQPAMTVSGGGRRRCEPTDLPCCGCRRGS